MIRRRFDPRSWGLLGILGLTACGSRSSLELAIDGSSVDGGDGGNESSGGGQGTGGGSGRDTGGQAAGGQAAGGQSTGGGQQTGGQGAGGSGSGGANTGGTGTGGEGAGGSGGQGTGGAAMCPMGYVDEGDGCQPVLTDLVPNFGIVSPTVTPLDRDYAITVPLWTEGLTLVPYSASGVTVDVFGQIMMSGDAWRPPELTPGVERNGSVTLSQAGFPSTQYQLSLLRQGRLDYVKASNADEEDFFGIRIALSADGRTMAVGAPGEDSGAIGINGDKEDDSAPAAGAVYVLVRDGSTWTEQAYIKASNPDAGDCFGASIDLSADGNVLIVGAWAEDSAATGIQGDASDDSASFAGAAYVFTRTGTSWQEEAYVKASNSQLADQFGLAVTISDDGSTFAVGAYGEDSSATGINGDQDLNDAAMAGAAYVFSRNGGTIVQEAYVKASNPDPNDSFGTHLVLSGDGNTLVVSADSEDSAATGIDGDQWDNGASSSGVVYVFERTGSTWTQTAYVKASNTDPFDMFGYAPALSSDGSTLAIGAFAERSLSSGIDGDQEDNSGNTVGAVYVLSRSGPSWVQEAYVKASNPHAAIFGHSLALSASGDVLFVGASAEDYGGTGIDAVQTGYMGALDSGAVYRFQRSSSWTQSAYVKASNTGADDAFGRSVATSSDGRTLAVSAYFEDSASTGTAGNQTNDDAPNAGAVYVFAEE